MKNLPTILSHLMSKNEITSSQLARKTGIGQPVIYRLMKGDTENPQILTLKPIADFFKISIDQLLGYTPLYNQKLLSNERIHSINNKLSTVKTIASVVVDILPELIEGYQKAVSTNIIKESIPSNVLPLLQLNIITLTKAANQAQELLIINNDIEN